MLDGRPYLMREVILEGLRMRDTKGLIVLIDWLLLLVDCLLLLHAWLHLEEHIVVIIQVFFVIIDIAYLPHVRPLALRSQ